MCKFLRTINQSCFGLVPLCSYDILWCLPPPHHQHHCCYHCSHISDVTWIEETHWARGHFRDFKTRCLDDSKLLKSAWPRTVRMSKWMIHCSSWGQEIHENSNKNKNWYKTPDAKIYVTESSPKTQAHGTMNSLLWFEPPPSVYLSIVRVRVCLCVSCNLSHNCFPSRCKPWDSRSTSSAVEYAWNQRPTMVQDYRKSWKVFERSTQWRTHCCLHGSFCIQSLQS